MMINTIEENQKHNNVVEINLSTQKEKMSRQKPRENKWQVVC